MKVLFLGDIISRTGRQALKSALPRMKRDLDIDLCIGNVENAAGIFGITAKVAEEISHCGVDVMTGGNHIWDKAEGIALLDSRDDILRPANYPPGAQGRGFLVKDVAGTKAAVINLQGRTFMSPIDCPFRGADAVLSMLPPDARIIVVDFHAEATSEKVAMGFYLDGRVSAVAGTHTHVQTADERLLPEGTAFITDVGMVGPLDSVLGIKKRQVIDRFLYGIRVRFDVARENPYIDALFVDIEEDSGRALSIRRIHEPAEQGGGG